MSTALATSSAPHSILNNTPKVNDKDFIALLSPLMTVSVKDLTRVIESLYSKKSEEKGCDVPPAALSQYRDALKRYTTKDSTKLTPRQARVAFFHWNDGVSEKKTLKGGDDEKDDKTVVKKTSPVSTSKKTAPTQRRKRVIAYIWVDVSEGDTRKGLVFYGGSVFNPTLTMRTLLQLCVKSRVHTADDLPAFYQTLKSEVSGHHVYNRKGEKETAFGRLRQRPVVFETTATTHAQVRQEIHRQMFTRGVYGPRHSFDEDKVGAVTNPQ